MKSVVRFGLHVGLILALTLLTQIGGLAWLLALLVRHRLLGFALAYIALSGSAYVTAPLFGRVALPCFASADRPLAAGSILYCAINRHYVVPELAGLAADLATRMAAQHPGTITQYLDANFPFFDGFPLLPHLSHDDGRKLDLGFYYTDPGGAYLTGKMRSPLGYWGFEDVTQTSGCPDVGLTMRWNLAWLQPVLPDRPLEQVRTAELLQLVLTDTQVSRVFVEPYLAAELGQGGVRLGFQGCRAARHDDHIHLQIAE